MFLLKKPPIFYVQRVLKQKYPCYLYTVMYIFPVTPVVFR